MQFKQTFQESYDELIINESLSSIFSSPKTIIAAALLLGIIDATYTIPKLQEIKQKITAKLQTKEPEVVQQIEQKAAQTQNLPKVQQFLARLMKSPKITHTAPQQHTKQVQPKAKADEYLKKAMDVIKKYEIGGMVKDYHKMYKDSKGLNTIGIGHLVLDEELPLYQGKTLTEKEVLDLFVKDSQIKLQRARRIFPKFDSYSDDLKVALLNGVFRGEFKAGHDAVKLINRGQWKKAAEEYLDNAEYKNAVEENNAGVRPRMEFNAKVIASQQKS